jgi:hypothetical protein
MSMIGSRKVAAKIMRATKMAMRMKMQTPVEMKTVERTVMVRKPMMWKARVGRMTKQKVTEETPVAQRRKVKVQAQKMA